jgi:hypothetical protein
MADLVETYNAVKLPNFSYGKGHFRGGYGLGQYIK